MDDIGNGRLVILGVGPGRDESNIVDAAGGCRDGAARQSQNSHLLGDGRPFEDLSAALSLHTAYNITGSIHCRHRWVGVTRRHREGNNLERRFGGGKGKAACLTDDRHGQHGCGVCQQSPGRPETYRTSSDHRRVLHRLRSGRRYSINRAYNCCKPFSAVIIERCIRGLRLPRERGRSSSTLRMKSRPWREARAATACAWSTHPTPRPALPSTKMPIPTSSLTCSTRWTGPWRSTTPRIATQRAIPPLTSRPA